MLLQAQAQLQAQAYGASPYIPSLWPYNLYGAAGANWAAAYARYCPKLDRGVLLQCIYAQDEAFLKV